MIEDPRGQWAHPGKNTRIPGNQITMEGVDYPVWAVPDVGEPVLMQPGQNYTFPGASYVDEYPMLEQEGQLPIAKKGGEYETKELTDAEIEEYVKGGYIVEEELPKAQTGLGKLVKYFKPKPITIPKPSVTPTIKYNPKDMNYVDVHNSLRRVQTNNKLKFDVLKKGRYDGLFPSTYAKRRDGINEIKSLINERTSFDENFKITHDNLTNDYVKKVTERNRIKDRKEAVERMEIDKIVGSNPSPDQLEFIKKYPSYSTWLYKNNKGDLIGDYKNAFDSNIVDDAIKQQSTFVRGVKNAPNEEVAKQWLTSIGDVKAKDRRLLNLGDAVYGSNAIGIMESFGRGDDVSGNFGGLLELDLGLDGLPPIEKIEGFEKAIRQASDMVSIPGYPNISIGDAAALNKNEELRNLGIKAIDSVYTTHSSERGVIDDAIIKIDKLIDLSNIGTTKPLGSGGMWGYINGEAIKADEELFHHVNNIPNLHTAWSSKEAKDKWMSKWRKIHMKLSTIHDDLYNQMRNAKGKLDDVSVYKDHNKEEIAILTENLLQMQKELKGKLQKTIGQTGLGIGIGLFGVGLYNAEPTERSKKRRLERYSQRKNKNRKLVNNKPSTKNTNSPLPKNMLGGELLQDQYNDTPEFDGDLPEIVNSKEHGVDTPVYVQVEEKESPIHGTGVFSKEPISKGQSIGVSHIRKEFEKNGKMYQAPFPSKQIGGYNHSEEPNVTEVDNGDHITLIAIRDIQPGEELVSNYDDSEIQDMERSSDFIRKDVPKAKDGHTVKQRRGVRNNPDAKYFRNGGFTQNDLINYDGPRDYNYLLDDVYSKYPALKIMQDDLKIFGDPSFTREATGVGDIEFFGKNDETFTYPTGFKYDNPNPGGYGIPFNPKNNNSQGIALDMLHGMDEADPKYKKLKEEFATNFLASKFKEDFDSEAKWLKDDVGEEQYNEWYKSDDDFFNKNYIDGIIRNLLYEGTAEDFKRDRYWDKAQEVYLSVPELKESFNNLKKYLTTKPITPDQYIQAELTPEN
jgi:hypothetical protein